ncbi:MAG: DUF3048 domain-containing protein, partial [Bacillota bacterium]|nr:DUF3048 domain-containing protein [Bacillota bacterium]
MNAKDKMANKKILGIAIAGLLIVIVGTYSIMNSLLAKPEEEVPAVVDIIDEEIEEIEEVEETGILAPLTGMAVEQQIAKRPIAITIENSPAARPQSGLREADVVYEVLAEGGITRFLAIFQQGEADMIGPIRSARDYLAYMSHDFDGVFVHIGGSPGGYAYVNQKSVANIDAFYIGSGEFWRTKDRIAP